jgi:small-conductance mechanosensitive channel
MPQLPDLTSVSWATSPWVQAPAALVLWIAVFLIVKRIVLATLRRMAARTPWAWDDVLIDALSTPLLVTILGSGFLVFDRILPLAPEWDRAFDVLFAFAISLSLVLFVDRVTRGVLDRLAAGSPVLQGARGLIQGGVRGLIIGIGLLIFLDSIGISITPILASLGVGSLAVALALQDTLANLFAGLYMIADKPIEPGHMIRLPGGEEGYVTRVGWRSTWIRMPQNNMLIIPNARLAGGTIINYDLPQPEVNVTVTAGVHYDSDLERVETVTLEVAREVQATVTGAVHSAEPSVRYQQLGDSSIQFQVNLRAVDFAGSAVVKHEFLKRIQVRFRRDGIVVPYPIRTLDFPPGHTTGLRDALGGGDGPNAPERSVGFTRPAPPDRRGS